MLPINRIVELENWFLKWWPDLFLVALNIGDMPVTNWQLFGSTQLLSLSCCMSWIEIWGWVHTVCNVLCTAFHILFYNRMWRYCIMGWIISNPIVWLPYAARRWEGAGSRLCQYTRLRVCRYACCFCCNFPFAALTLLPPYVYLLWQSYFSLFASKPSICGLDMLVGIWYFESHS